MKKIASLLLAKELEKAGLLGLPFCWGEDGQVTFSAGFPEAKKAAVLKVFEDHDPDKIDPSKAQKALRKKAVLDKLKLSKADIQGLSELIQDGTDD